MSFSLLSPFIMQIHITASKASDQIANHPRQSDTDGIGSSGWPFCSMCCFLMDSSTILQQSSCSAYLPQ